MKELSKSIPEPEPAKEVIPEPPPKKDNTTDFTVKKEEFEQKDRPYPAEYFDVPEWGRLITDTSLDIYGMKDKVVFIEQYLMEKLANNSMKSDREGVYGILKEIEDQLAINDKFQPHARIDKVYNFLKTIKINSEIQLERKRKLMLLLKKS